MRIFLIFIVAFFLFNGLLYALRPSDVEETLSEDIKEEIIKVQKEKERLIKSAAPIREKRKETLHPFVYDAEEKNPEGLRDVKSIPTRYEGRRSGTRSSEKGIFLKAILKIIFLLIIGAGFLAAYFFIRPKSK